MSRTSWSLAALAAVAVAGGGGFVAGRADLWPFNASKTQVDAATAGKPEAAVLYYEDPDGKSDYSPVPKKTTDGRDYRPIMAPEEPAKAAPAVAPADRKIKYYRNPMGLPDTSQKPKKDSMGMDYIPVYDGEDTDDGSVKVSVGRIQRTGVQTEAVSERVIQSLVRAPGTIQLDERRVSVIALRAEAFVEKVEDVTTGSQVRKGQQLLRAYMPAAVAAAAQYSVTGPSANGNGARQRLMNLGVPEGVIKDIERKSDTPIAMIWTAPRDGIVTERNVVEGQRVDAGQVLFRVADVSVVWAMIDVAERDFSSLAVGQTVSIRAKGQVGRVFAGPITALHPQINRETRTGRARVELANKDTALLPDMYVDAEIDKGSGASVLAVPESAVIDTGGKQMAFVDKGEGQFEPRDLVLGARGDGYVEIRSGVEKGESIVVAANFLIDAESNLRAAAKSFTAGEAPK